MTSICIADLDSLPEAAQEFIEATRDARIIAFYAEMGTGKTTLIRAVCEALGVKDIINSPTFSIINEYVAEPSGELIYHFDCYRLSSQAEAQAIGVEEYFDRGARCYIEWPEVIEDILPEDVLCVRISEQGDGSRLVEIDT